MWFVATPDPVPSPIDVYLHSDPGTWLDVWGPTLLGFIGSLVVAAAAVIGVIIGANKNARAIISAETERHNHAVAHSDTVWRRDTKSTAYFNLLNALERADTAIYQFKWYTRDGGKNAGGSYEYAPMSFEMAEKQTEAWDIASDDVGNLCASIRAIGTTEIAVEAEAALDYFFKAMFATHAAIDAAMATPPNPLPPVDEVAADERANALVHSKKVTALVRAELGADAPA